MARLSPFLPFHADETSWSWVARLAAFHIRGPVSIFLRDLGFDLIGFTTGEPDEIMRFCALAGQDPVPVLRNTLIRQNGRTHRLGEDTLIDRLSLTRNIRFAHNAAINYLRQRKYVKSTKILADNMVITPAMIGQTVLERLNGVLDPDDRINGMIQLELLNVQLPVSGLGNAKAGTAGVNGSISVRQTDGAETYPNHFTLENQSSGMAARISPAGIPEIFAELNGVEAGGVSLTDFYNAQEMDRLVRTMRSIVDANPEYGEEMILRWAHGLSVDSGHIPFVISHQSRIFGRGIAAATDTAGVQENVMRSDMMLEMNFTVPIPRTELGGIIITFAVLKPDETLSSQPHPYLSDVWGPDNYVADATCA